MARRLCVLLTCLATFWLARPTGADGPRQVAADEKRLEGAGLKHDGAALLAFFRERSLTDAERANIELLINRLGARSFKSREQAAAELVARGPVVVELLRAHLKDIDPEVIRRAEQCIDRIKTKDHPPEVALAAARLLVQRKPAGTIEVLLAYLPFADNEAIADEARAGLANLAVADGKPAPALVSALTDKHPVRRAAAGEALCRAKATSQKDAVARLLRDPEPTVRLRVALALTLAEDRKAVQELIDLLVPLPQAQAWQAEDILFRLAAGKNPPTVALGADPESRKKCRDAWDRWWKENGAAVDLAKLGEMPRLLGHTVIVLLDMNRVLEVDGEGKTAWKLDGVIFPLDIEYLPNDRILVAEYHAAQVAERDVKTNRIMWRYPVTGPLVAQRLANGNTFIVTDSQLLEVDRGHKQVFTFSFPDGQKIMKGMKLANGEIVCLTHDARVVRLDSTGKELKSFPVSLGTKLFGGRIHMQPNGRVLVPHNAENKVVEYDVNGKQIWEVAIDQPIAATRLPNGNTLVTSMSQNRAVEFDRNGTQVWEYRASTRVTRAVRR